MPEAQIGLCGRMDCQMQHGLYPNMEHEYMEMPAEEFEEWGKKMRYSCGIWLERRDGQLYVVREGS